MKTDLCLSPLFDEHKGSVTMFFHLSVCILNNVHKYKTATFHYPNICGLNSHPAEWECWRRDNHSKKKKKIQQVKRCHSVSSNIQSCYKTWWCLNPKASIQSLEPLGRSSWRGMFLYVEQMTAELEPVVDLRITIFTHCPVCNLSCSHIVNPEQHLLSCA